MQQSLSCEQRPVLIDIDKAIDGAVQVFQTVTNRAQTQTSMPTTELPVIQCDSAPRDTGRRNLARAFGSCRQRGNPTPRLTSKFGTTSRLDRQIGPTGRKK